MTNHIEFTSQLYRHINKTCHEFLDLMTPQDSFDADVAMEATNESIALQKLLELNAKISKRICDYTYNYSIEPISETVRYTFEKLTANVSSLISNCTNLQQCYLSDDFTSETARGRCADIYYDVIMSYKQDIKFPCQYFFNGTFINNTSVSYTKQNTPVIFDPYNMLANSESPMLVLGMSVAAALTTYAIYKGFKRYTSHKPDTNANEPSTNRKYRATHKQPPEAKFAQIPSAAERQPVAERQQLEKSQPAEAQLQKEWANITRRVVTNTYP